MAFPSRSEYEQLLYDLANSYPQITRSTLTLYTTSPLTGVVEGSIVLENGLELRIAEALDFKNSRIQRYSYTVFRDGQKVRWYDAQPHPELPELSSTFPHHRHELPDPKNNRRPAPGITFDSPNLPALIADCIELARDLQSEP